ncbi:hypothetical protein PoB_001658900 [Plakobranchus ocellatus]|uniref:Uncharacterized protein n=1 Tax=Plakobranchus ocellatus TaxID=259542 RepID=A0AAV3Z7U3_9GAST|nr:hypothetical protein PoB_001658900 [Plakobranchus ocellatus]
MVSLAITTDNGLGVVLLGRRSIKVLEEEAAIVRTGWDKGHWWPSARTTRPDICRELPSRFKSLTGFRPNHSTPNSTS